VTIVALESTNRATDLGGDPSKKVRKGAKSTILQSQWKSPKKIGKVFPMWVIKEIDKIRKGFLWRGRREVKGGHCMVAWGKVCRPLNFGGLGISSLPELCWALRMRWLWLQRADPTRPWNNLPVHVPNKAKAFFSSMLVTEIGDGANTYFWSDKWINARSVSDIAPRLLLTVPKRIVSKRTVREALTNRRWVSDIKGALTWGALVDYLHLWNAITDVVLQPNSEDKHIFSIASNGQYSASSAYKGFFTGSVGFEHYKMVWKSCAPPKCRFLLWLVAHNRCWTADRLEKRGLNHPPRCSLCDQEPETINHLLVSCSFSRIYWYITLRKFGLHILAPLQEYKLPAVVETYCCYCVRHDQEGGKFTFDSGRLDDLEVQKQSGV
jgi:hypothetical protein